MFALRATKTVFTRFLKAGDSASNRSADRVCATADEALNAVAQKSIDLALLDVSVVTVRGAIDLCRELRKSCSGPLPIGLLCPPGYKIDPPDRILAGASLVAGAPCNQQQFEASVIKLASLNKPEQSQTIKDESTGLLIEREFMTRANRALINCGRSSQEMVLCLLRLSGMNAGTQAGLDPLIAPVIGKLLSVRFPSETLRGMWGEGFGLVFCNEDWKYVEEALGKWTQETARVTAAASDGSRVQLFMQWKIAKYPLDGFSLESLVSAVRRRR